MGGGGDAGPAGLSALIFHALLQRVTGSRFLPLALMLTMLTVLTVREP